jgi:DNA segregation ATPase FtsK/SpoIIIE-like protein
VEASAGSHADGRADGQTEDRIEARPDVTAKAAAREGSFDFKVPVIPAPPRLRSLGEKPEQAGQAVAERGAGLEETGDPASNEAEEPPIPLFFRPAAPVSGAPLTGIANPENANPEDAHHENANHEYANHEYANHEYLSEPSVGTREIVVGPGQEILSLAGATKPIEFTSVPPAPAALGPEEVGKAAALARILARKKKVPYAVPVDGLLMQYPDGQYWIVDEKTKRSAEILRDTLAEFKIEAEVTGIRKGPVITMFEILPAPGVRLSKIANLSDNIALRLAASSVRIVAPIPGKHAVGIEVPNERRSIVSLREIVESETFVSSKCEIPVALGKDITGEVQFIDLVQTPHLLIAGATGSGKSVCVNAIILSILFRRSPEDVRLLLIDPKIVELKLYNGVAHLLTPVITEPKRAFQALQYCICEMERRYAMLDRVGVRDIKSYNRKIKEKGLAQEKLPYIVVIIDEFADLMATTGKELESTLARLAAMSRAVGIHLVLATQRPSIDVITGLIKANIPSRIAFMVASKFDSRIIIDMVGAEKLLGRGDMLFASAWDPFPIRMQGAFVSEEEVEKSVEFVKTLGEPDYIDEDIFIDDDEDEAEPNLFDDGDGDPLFEQALEIVLQQGKASASYIQRKLKIGYNRAARLVELMEEKGIVGKAQGSKPRDLVRNPEVAGFRGGDSPGVSRSSLRAAEAARAAGPEADDTAVGDTAVRAFPSLIPAAETVPGQRVTGRDED